MRAKINYLLNGTMGSVEFEGSVKDYELFYTALRRMQDLQIIKENKEKDLTLLN